jgi:hypothetical protein
VCLSCCWLSVIVLYCTVLYCTVLYLPLPLVLLFLCALLPDCSWSFVYCFIILDRISVTSCLLLYCVYTAVLHTVVPGLLTRSQYPEGPATGHLDTGFSWFPCVYKRMLRRFPRLQIATTCFSCSPLFLNFLDPYFIFMYMHYNHCHRATAHLHLNI